jgi:hypothetical protein
MQWQLGSRNRALLKHSLRARPRLVRDNTCECCSSYLAGHKSVRKKLAQVRLIAIIVDLYDRDHLTVFGLKFVCSIPQRQQQVERSSRRWLTILA